MSRRIAHALCTPTPRRSGTTAPRSRSGIPSRPHCTRRSATSRRLPATTRRRSPATRRRRRCPARTWRRRSSIASEACTSVAARGSWRRRRSPRRSTGSTARRPPVRRPTAVSPRTGADCEADASRLAADALALAEASGRPRGVRSGAQHPRHPGREPRRRRGSGRPSRAGALAGGVERRRRRGGRGAQQPRPGSRRRR